MERNPTDKRIDDLSGRVDCFEDKVDQRFDKVDQRFERFEDKVDARFAEVDARFDTVLTKDEFKRAETVQTMRFEFIAARMAEVDQRLDKWGRTMAGAVVAIAVGVIVKLLGA
jgi:tetrahydromethanopterin S-methyltransferase subunit G